jgi:hypothetical protein
MNQPLRINASFFFNLPWVLFLQNFPVRVVQAYERKRPPTEIVHWNGHKTFWLEAGSLRLLQCCLVSVLGIVKDECAVATPVLHALQLRIVYAWTFTFIELPSGLHQLQRGSLNRPRGGQGPQYLALWSFERGRTLARNNQGGLVVFAGKCLSPSNEVLAR